MVSGPRRERYMHKFLEYVIELKMQAIAVIQKEVESLNKLDIVRFKCLQAVESELLGLLDQVHKDMRTGDKKFLIANSDYGDIEKLSAVCADFYRHMALKHDREKSLYREIYGVTS